VAIGTAANYAAKMLAKASANEIVIGESVKNALPLDWQESFAEVLVTDKGPVIPCNLYRYTGRWI
jgi:adenylate cyclase